MQVNHNRFLGYTKDDEGNLIIEPTEAAVIKRIYREYLEGASYRDICNDLMADGILTGAGKKKWIPSTIHKILSNEKYIGDALLQKTITTNLLEKKMISSKLPASEVMDEKGEYHHQYSSLSSQADNLLKAYAESYDEIVRGYEDGTREVWVEDKNADGGVRKLTKEEDLAALDKAYQDRVDSFTQNNDKKIIDALAANAKKIMEATGGRTKIAKEVSPELEKKQAELEKLPADIDKKMKDAAMSFKVQYGLQQAGQIDISNILKGISIFGIK